MLPWIPRSRFFASGGLQADLRAMVAWPYSLQSPRPWPDYFPSDVPLHDVSHPIMTPARPAIPLLLFSSILCHSPLRDSRRLVVVFYTSVVSTQYYYVPTLMRTLSSAIVNVLTQVLILRCLLSDILDHFSAHIHPFFSLLDVAVCYVRRNGPKSQ